MFSRPLASYPVVQGLERVQSDAVWITEDVLARAFQRSRLFKRPSRRHASSVPGPMESRRRLGKRRMGNLTEAMQPPIQNLATFWDLTGTAPRDQWHWEAPITREPSVQKKSATQLPAWLSEHEPIPSDDVQGMSEAESHRTANLQMLSTGCGDDINRFRESLKTSSADQIQDVCNVFYANFSQSLALGLVSVDALSSHIQDVVNDIWTVSFEKGPAASRCFAFYLAIWKGIKACKVLRLADIRSGTFDQLLCLLAQIPSTPAVHTLATDIIQAASLDQLAEMEGGISFLTNAWVSSWAHVEYAQPRGASEALTSSTLDDFASQQLTESAMALANALGRLPPRLASSVIHKSTDHIITSCMQSYVGPTRMLRRFRYAWLQVVANMPCLDDELLAGICRIMNFGRLDTKESTAYVPSIPKLTLYEVSRLLLDFWSSHSQIKETEHVKTWLSVATCCSKQPYDLGYLIQAMAKHQELSLEKTRCLLYFLRCLEKPQVVVNALKALRDQSPELFVSFLSLEMQEMRHIDLRCMFDLRYALNICTLHDTIRHDHVPLSLEESPAIVIAMIRNPHFTPAEIWRSTLGEEALSDLYGPWNRHETLPEGRGKLVHRMALAFAQVEHLSARVALRNVHQCAIYLRAHRARMPDMMRAMSFAGITRGLLEQKIPGEQKAAWIINQIRKVEGIAAARKVGQVVAQYQDAQIKGFLRSKRDANPMGAGRFS